MRQERILREATFAPSAVTYQTLGVVLVCVLTVVGIPLLIVALPFARWYWKKQYAHLQVILTSRDLKVHRGVFVREEKSIPLEKITDLAVVQGPIMRRFGLKGIKVETAGQTSTGGALVTVVGIIETESFRDMVLSQRDRIADSDSEPTRLPGAEAVPAGSVVGSEPVIATLRSIDDTLRRIEIALAAAEGPNTRTDG